METESFIQTIKNKKQSISDLNNKFLDHLKEKIKKESDEGQSHCTFYSDILYSDASNIARDFNLDINKYNDMFYYAMEMLDKDGFKISIRFQHSIMKNRFDSLAFDVSW